MTAVHDRIPYVESQSSTERPPVRPSQQSVLLVAAAVVALLAVAAGVVVACLVFPEPTMWRVAVNGAVIASAVLPIRALVRRASAHAARRFAAEGESEI